MHGFALARGADDVEAPVGRATEAAAALERVTAGENPGPLAAKPKPPDGTPVAVVQNTARDLPVSDVVSVGPGRALSGELRVEQHRPRARGPRRRR